MAFGILFLRNTIRRFRMVWVCWFLAAIILFVLPYAHAGIDSITLRLQASSSSSVTSISSSSESSSSDQYKHQPQPPSSSSISSSSTSSCSTDHPLFWSSYQCNLHAATLNMGPLDLFLRQGEHEEGGGGLVQHKEETVFTTIMNFMNNIPRGGRLFFNRNDHSTSVLTADNSSSTITTTAAATSLTVTNSSSSPTLLTSSSLETEETDEIVAPRIRILETNTVESKALTSSSSTRKWNWRKGMKSDSTTESSSRKQEQPKKSYRYSLFQKNDGSETDPDGIPTRFINMHPNRRDLSLSSLQSTLEWRKLHDIDGILERPQKKFDICKAVFPHAFLGRDRIHQKIIFIQRPALLNIELAKKNGLTQDELLMHYIYVNEYLWQIIEKEDALATMTSVIDLTGLRFSVLSKREIVSFLQTFVTTMDSHYPQRAHKTFLLNAPGWFQAIYSLISPLMRESTKSKIHILSRGKVQDDTLLEYLGLDMMNELLPPIFQSTYQGENMDLLQPMPVASQHTDLEQELHAFTLGRLEDAGEKMQTLIPL